MVINLFWLFPLAVVTYLIPNMGIWITVLAFTPLIALAIKLKAGIKEKV